MHLQEPSAGPSKLPTCWPWRSFWGCHLYARSPHIIPFLQFRSSKHYPKLRGLSTGDGRNDRSNRRKGVTAKISSKKRARARACVGPPSWKRCICSMRWNCKVQRCAGDVTRHEGLRSSTGRGPQSRGRQQIQPRKGIRLCFTISWRLLKTLFAVGSGAVDRYYRGTGVPRCPGICLWDNCAGQVDLLWEHISC